jgi:hypothetical protein
MMHNAAPMTPVARTFAAGEMPAVNSENILSNDKMDLVCRAASFRIEAQWLLVRADAADEPVMREQYLSLANRWATLAASLEAETMLRLDP